MIRVEGLVARYGRAVAVDGLSLHIPEGSFFGLLGPNGAGKTTFISCLAGLHPPAGGTIRVAGFDPVRQPREVLDVLGVVPQRIALYGRLSVVENLRVFAGLHGLHGRALSERVEWGLELSQLTAHRTKRVEALSGGMQRRLNLAVGLLHKPKVAVCDEPTAGVDPQSRNHIFATLRELHAQGLTVVYTTHYLEEVEALCDQIAIVDRGHVVRTGPLAELLQGHAAKRVELLHPTDREKVVAALEAAGIAVGETRGRTLEDLLLELTGSALRE
ncbi:MAG: ABC transporter ATP-binding protein [Alphaproteobacteria bacterium]|nr:ABC transporter ATP-binding protein [Alphaproteobacteria bacterium]